jgi:hypothetical protein
MRLRWPGRVFAVYRLQNFGTAVVFCMAVKLGLSHWEKGTRRAFNIRLILYVELINIVITGCGPVQYLKNVCDEMFITDLKTRSVLSP